MTSLSKTGPVSSAGSGKHPAKKQAPAQAQSQQVQAQTQPLYVTFPINTYMELKLSPDSEVVRGLVYTTDEISNSIVLKKALSHSTVTSEIRIINAASVLEKKTIPMSNGGGKSNVKVGLGTKASNSPTINAAASGESNKEASNEGVKEESPLPLPSVSKKSLEEKERRAIMLAEESFGQINQKASPYGQEVFDRLVKACNEVVWRGESIFVLNQVRVDPPYGKEDCKSLMTSTGNEGSLERVKMIVAAANVDRGGVE